ncbi:MAG: VWA domain-containing protein [Myxococcales bacterium]|nr:VWA domain-containing protein [Deltaproteobacteria bacterium]NNE17467.1 VWA domain-containing protein [Myxococcales bacterium]
MSEFKRMSQLRAGALHSVVVALLLTPSATFSQPNEGEANQLIFVLDASGSMWGRLDGQPKIEIARRSLEELLGALPDDAAVGLVAYGHRRKSDCNDIETLVTPATASKVAAAQQIDALKPKGKTPITSALRQALEASGRKGTATTIVLLTDGLETCGGDPCALMREAKAANAEIVLHVIGFDVDKLNVSELECAAQAAGGLYLDASDAKQLSEALDQVAHAPQELAGRLSIKAMANGKLTDVVIDVSRATDRERIAGGRTYASPETNPRVLPVPAGKFDVKVAAVNLEGKPVRWFKGLEIPGDTTVTKVVDFSTGKLSVTVRRNGELSDATVRVFNAGTREDVARSRTYVSPKSNPSHFELTSGTYDIVIQSVEIKGAPEVTKERIEIKPRGTVSLAHGYSSGTLRIRTTHAGALADAVVRVIRIGDRTQVAQGRTYTREESNPREFELEPGTYRVIIKPIQPKGAPEKTVDVVVTTKELTEQDLSW